MWWCWWRWWVKYPRASIASMERALLGLPRTGNCAGGINVTKTAIQWAHIDQLTAFSFCVVLVTIETIASTLKPVVRVTRQLWNMQDNCQVYTETVSRCCITLSELINYLQHYSIHILDCYELHGFPWYVIQNYTIHFKIIVSGVLQYNQVLHTVTSYKIIHVSTCPGPK